MDVELVIYTGPEAGQRQRVTHSPFVIGRHPDSGLPVTDPQVSRRHFQLTLHEDKVMAEDLGSTHGLFVNGSRVTSATLSDLDRISVGRTDIQVHIRVDEANVSAPSAETPRSLSTDFAIESSAATALVLDIEETALGDLRIYHLGEPLSEPSSKSDQRPIGAEPPRLDCTAFRFTENRTLYLQNTRRLLCAVADGAQKLDLIFDAKVRSYDPISLFVGQRAEQMMEVAPYFFTIPHGSPFLEKWTACLGRNIGLLIDSPAQPEQVFFHLRKLFVGDDQLQQENFVRFYDPRIFRELLASRSGQEIVDFFGPIHAFMVENEDGTGYDAFTLAEDQTVEQNPLGLLEVKK